ncbi:MAG: UDP-2,3-diacylglucosamine diphosphatase [Pseudobdellovibrio sp.]
MNSWFISDLHLKDSNERNGNTLLRFLFMLNKNPKQNHLFLLGDIFDMWISNGSAFTDHYAVIINEIKKFKDGGGVVYYFEGNHDFHIDTFWTRELGIKVIEDIEYFDLVNYKVRVEHGDFINPDDKAYLRYRALVRHPLVEPLGHLLSGYFWKWFGENQSQKSRKKTSRYAIENSEKVKKLIRTYAENVHRVEEPFDLIVTGHMHVFDDYEFEVNGKKVRSINLGTWLDKPRALKISSQKIEIINVLDII